RYITEGKNPEDAMAFATCGPNDPDPAPALEDKQDKLDGNLTRYNLVGATGRSSHTAAAQIPTPRLTVPINNRSP
ncbi:MAG: hypothetical protein OXI16_03830, partial [Chloroflexota bacterium]|nr:hypothetical protein [Chloroflexota bacterium]